MTEKITDAMREKLRKPLPPGAISPHPTKSYLSTIKSIYVAERINDVFGIGSWTLKGEPVEMTEHIVMRVVLEIPEFGFYGEAYGGNENADRGDAFKGAVTDGFTKISAQQLEIGIDVFKGLQISGAKPAAGGTKPTKEHWCKEHDTAFFKRGRMKSYAHPIGDTGEWCHEHKEQAETPPTEPIEKIFPDETPPDASTAEKTTPDEGTAPNATDELLSKVAEAKGYKNYKTARSYLVNSLKIEDSRINTEPATVWEEIKEYFS